MRYVRRHFPILLAALLFTVIPTLEAAACSCARKESPRAYYRRAEAIFTGEILETEERYETRNGKQISIGTRARVRVEEAFLGLEWTQGKEVLIDGSSLMCPLWFSKGDRLLIYSFLSYEGTFLVGPCSGIAPLEQAEEQLEFLRKLPGCLFGHVDSQGAPMKRARITVRGEGIKRSARTNEYGQFQVRELPPGKYTVELRSSKKYLGENREIEVPTRGCGRVDFSAMKADEEPAR